MYYLADISGASKEVVWRSWRTLLVLGYIGAHKLSNTGGAGAVDSLSSAAVEYEVHSISRFQACIMRRHSHEFKHKDIHRHSHKYTHR